MSHHRLASPRPPAPCCRCAHAPQAQRVRRPCRVKRRGWIRASASRASFVCGRFHYQRALITLQVFVNRADANDDPPPPHVAPRASSSRPQPVSSSAPPADGLAPLRTAPFGVLVSDTQSTISSPSAERGGAAAAGACARGRGSIAQLQPADDRYRPCSNGRGAFLFVTSIRIDHFSFVSLSFLPLADAVQMQRALRAQPLRCSVGGSCRRQPKVRRMRVRLPGHC